MRLETVKVKTDYGRGWKIINASDFDPKRHVLVGSQSGATIATQPKPDPALSVVPAQTPPEPADDIAALRAEYEMKFGKRPFMGWDAETIKAKMAE